jgi:hypothetical protein
MRSIKGKGTLATGVTTYNLPTDMVPLAVQLPPYIVVLKP